MGHSLGGAKKKGGTDGAIREAMAAVVATKGGRPRAQAREAFRGGFDPEPIPRMEGCCGHENIQ